MWQTFVSSLRVYEPLSVGGANDPHEGRYDFDGAEEKKKSLESFIIQLFALLLTIVGGRRLAKAAANRFSESHKFIHLHLSPTWIGLMGKWVSLGLWPFYFYFFLLLLFVCLLFFKCTPVCHAKATPIFIIFLVFPTLDAKDSFSKFYF